MKRFLIYELNLIADLVAVLLDGFGLDLHFLAGLVSDSGSFHVGMGINRSRSGYGRKRNGLELNLGQFDGLQFYDFRELDGLELDLRSADDPRGGVMSSVGIGIGSVVESISIGPLGGSSGNQDGQDNLEEIGDDEKMTG